VRPRILLALALASAAPAAERPAAPARHACVSLFVTDGTALFGPVIADTIRALSTALTSDGFCLSSSPDDADIVVEVMARRQIRQRQSATVNVAFVMDLIRIQATAGEETAELRAYGNAAYQVTGSAVVNAALEIRNWVQKQAGRPARAAKAAAAPPAVVPVEALVARARGYVEGYEKQFASVIGDEEYRQEFDESRSIDINLRPAATRTTRFLKSEVSFAWFPDVRRWFGFRDVTAVDGKPVRDRDRRLAALFFEKPDSRALDRALEESARYNLGPIRRNFNVPMLALQFLEPDLGRRFLFDGGDVETIDGTATRVVRYRETAHPSIIKADGGDAPAHGRLWIEPATGRLLKTELSIANERSEIRIQTWYRPDARLGVLVPARMTESYDFVQYVYDHIACEARYANFRRFETSARIVGN
jgi:hypothetical protein